MSDQNDIIPKIDRRGANAAAALLEEGATVHFIARYRKEVTGGMDEVALFSLRDALSTERELEKRRRAILESLDERNLLTPELNRRILGAETKTALEDEYLPFRPKRRTRAMAAREAGLEPLAEALFRRQDAKPDIDSFVRPEKGISNSDEALAGARDILAEGFNEDVDLRTSLRAMSAEEGLFSAKVSTKKAGYDDAAVYRDYFDYVEKISRVPSHRILAVLRGGREGFLKVKARLEDKRALDWLERRLVKARGFGGQQVLEALTDSWKRLMAPSLETDLLGSLKERADAEAIRVFAGNLEKMLLAPPLGEKPLIAVDPGYRTGGKVAVLDAQGSLKAHAVIHPEGSETARKAAQDTLAKLAAAHGITIFAVGNGTAGRETEDFLKESFPDASVISVDERGASVYSASAEARREFGSLDLTIRGAVSIGRRLQDPLAELVKIDPESIGVGQYQHDVDAKELKSALDDTVRSAVNAVGVELNTASAPLLARVSGLGVKLAEAIVDYRQEKGAIQSRKDLMSIKGLGAKAFEQAAGFLRIRGARNPLDSSAVHPERYALVERMARDLGCSLEELMSSGDLQSRVELGTYVSMPEDTKDGVPVGLPTLKDIMNELAKPGRDPRETFEVFSFDERIRSIEDVEEGMVVPGLITNVTAFGAFVDIGAHRDGLVHISQIADRYVTDPSREVSVGDKVRVKVMDVDLKR
ncbi:MAG: Tex family protein, partial [Spirochaetaceae bacterium]|nr:Tex family protein [Spirochaetaceae bacterium]